MKLTIMILSLFTSFTAFAEETVVCKANKTFQTGGEKLPTNSEFIFTLERNGSDSEIKSLKGHLFVSYMADETLSMDNSYMGFFKIDNIKANPKYRPRKYIGFIQFKDVNAIHTTGNESGMWGDLVLDIRTPGKIEARYIFQAGDHMGGTTFFECKTRNN